MFDVSDPSFYVDGDLNLVPQQDVLYSGPVLFIHGLSTHANDTAQVDISGLPLQSKNTLRVSKQNNSVNKNYLSLSGPVFILHQS